jgi:hypothetical protein
MKLTLFSAVLIVGIVIAAIAVCIAVLVVRKLRRDAKSAGYDSVGAYLKSPPRSDREKRGAIDLGLKELVICLLGLIFPPFLLIGIFPLFYGLRKMAYASLGLGFVEDAEEEQTMP